MSEINSSVHLKSAFDQISQQVKEKSLQPKNERESSDYKKDLPLSKKQEIESFRQKSEVITDKTYEQISRIRESVVSDKSRINFLQARSDKTQDDNSEIERITNNANTNEDSIKKLHESTQESQELFQDLFQKITNESLNNYVDNKTGLYLASFTVDKLGEYLTTKNNPDNVKILLTDIMLLHTTNSILGSTETDRRLFSSAQASISVARYLSGSDFYPPYSSDESKSNKHLNKYFSENSIVREKLDFLKSQKVEISPFRVNAEGGDEFGFVIVTPENTDEKQKVILENISLEIIDHISESTSITKDFDFINEEQKNRQLTQEETEQRMSFYKATCDSISKYKIKQKSEKSDVFGQPRRDVPFTNEELINNAFCDSLRAFLLKNQDKDILNPSINLSVEQTKALLSNNQIPSLSDAFELFVKGQDSYSNTYPDQAKLINESGEIEQEVIKDYSEKIYQNIKHIVDNKALSSTDFNDLLTKEFSKLIIKNMFDSMGSRIDTFSKNNYKQNITFDAFTRQDTKSTLICGASSNSGRLLFDTKTDQEKIDFMSKVKQFYEEKFSTDDSVEIQDFKKDWQDRLSKININ